ncbi:actin-related protein 2/3 complex subunit 2B isoform X2 [Silene latifolia]|uniref:actin-related protein 2/3 complex subunit 2B isoform X2 n=1 Tax=Silene latifolia TaxID=37657 RepID=UPI003D77ABC5
MACFGLNGGRDKRSKAGFFERSSPALQQILLKIYRAQVPTEIDHHLYEFGSVIYHVQYSASDTHYIYLSISTPILTGNSESQELCGFTKEKINEICPSVVEILDQTREGYQLTLRLNVDHIPPGKDGPKVIQEIAALESVILSSQLKQMLHNFNLEGDLVGTYKPVKLMYRPREPFFVIRQPHKLTIVFPMRFKETSDVVIATSFFQELVEVGGTEALAKAPPCNWSPIPPPELRGELIEDLSTNGGFVSFDIFARHVDNKRLDKTVWILLNFHTYVKSHIKSTKGFIQRKLRGRLEDLVKVLHQPNNNEDEHDQKLKGCGWKMNPVRFSRFTKLRKRDSDVKKKTKRFRYRIRIHGLSELNRKIKRIHHRIKTRGFGHIRFQWFSILKFRSGKGYTRLE